MDHLPKVVFLNRSSPPHISTLILLAGISALAMNMFLPSLPGMALYFDTDYRFLQLSVALYLAINAALQVVIGPISDRFGRRPVVLAGLAIFLLATLGCILSTNVYVFLIFRMLQGTIVAAMVLSRAIVRDMLPQEQAASMIGYVTMGMAIVPMIGPAIGGVLDQLFDWHANFWLLLALGAMVTWLAWADLGETATTRNSSMRQQLREYPVLLKSYRFWGYTLTNTLSSGAFFAYLGGGPFVGAYIFELPPAQLGLYFGAPSIGYLIGNFLSGKLSVRIGINRMVLWGSLIASLGMAINLLMFQFGIGSALSFFGLMALLGLGNGMTIPNATAGALSVHPSLIGTASGLSGAMLIGGGAALSALAGIMLTSEGGAFPLLWIMFISSLLGVLIIYALVLRERRIVNA